MVGDAFMKIDDPEGAIRSCEAALTENSKDTTAAAQLGQAFAITHNYTKAIEHYECALQNIEDDSLGKLILSHDLAG